MKISPLKENISFKSAASKKVAQKVADVILSYRRPFPNETFSRSSYYYLSENISNKILPYIDKSEPLQIATVGFSMKCPNKKKVISDAACRAEYETFEHLNELTQKIRDIYKYGTDFKIFADGRIFVGTIFGSSDDAVTKYVVSCKNMLKKQKANDIKILSLDDFFKGANDSKRNGLFSAFPADITKMQKKTETDEFFKTYRKYMRDFYAKDIHAINPNISCKQSRQLADNIAFKVICAAEAYNQFINSLYKKPCLRLSVHAKPVYDAESKIGIFLNKIKKNMPTPWHSAAVKLTSAEGKHVFVYEKRVLLEQAGCNFAADIDGKGAYYIFPMNKKYDFSKSFKENMLTCF